MMTFLSDLADSTLTDEWIKNAEGRHPVLCIPYPEGMLLVVGTEQGFQKLTPKQQAEIGIEFIKAAVARL